MEGRKFSSSQRVVIYVRDMLSRYQPDAFRYFVAAAGPENQDADFTWSEFVRRTNDELVAGWGNLVNRTANMIAKNFGEIPAAGELTDTDRALLDRVEGVFGTVGDLIGRHRQKAAIGEAMRAVAEVNRYVSDSEPWKLKGEDQRERLGTILHVVAQCVSDLNTILSPFLPFSANSVDAVLGGSGQVQPMPRLEECEDLDGGPDYPILTGDYTAQRPGSGARSLPARRSPSRPRCSPSSTRRSWTRSSTGSRVSGLGDRCSTPAQGRTRQRTSHRPTRRASASRKRARALRSPEPLRRSTEADGALSALPAGARPAVGPAGGGRSTSRRHLPVDDRAQRAGVLLPGPAGPGPGRRRTTCAVPLVAPARRFRKDFGAPGAPPST